MTGRYRRRKKYSNAVFAFPLMIIALVLVCAALYLFVPSVKTKADAAYNSILDFIYDFLPDTADTSDEPEDIIDRGIAEKVTEGDYPEDLADSGITGENYSVDMTRYPYYSFLDSAGKALYKQICANVSAYEATFIPVASVTDAGLADAVLAVYCDHPEYIWLDNAYSYMYTDDGEIVQITITFNGLIDDISSTKAAFDLAADAVISQAESISGNFEREKYVHDAILNLCEYDEDASLSQSAYSALVLHESVCAGYARSFQYIMQELGIPTYYVVGTAEGSDHGWNIVMLSDGYYNVDPTWDDAVYNEYDFAYAFFNMPDSVFNETHMRTDLSEQLPACSGTAYYTPNEYGSYVY